MTYRLAKSLHRDDFLTLTFATTVTLTINSTPVILKFSQTFSLKMLRQAFGVRQGRTLQRVTRFTQNVSPFCMSKTRTFQTTTCKTHHSTSIAKLLTGL